MKVYIVFEGEYYDYDHFARHVFLKKEDAEFYIKTAGELENNYLTFVEFDLLDYEKKAPKIVYEYKIKCVEFKDGRPTEFGVKVKKKLDTDVPGTVHIYANGASIEIYIPREEEKHVNKERAIELFKEIRQQIKPEDSYEKVETQENFKKFEHLIKQMFD